MPDNMFFVFSNPVDGQEDVFNEWYETTHVPDVLKVPGITSAQRYAIAPMVIPENDLGDVPPPPHRYLVAYTFEGDHQAILASFLERMGSGQLDISPALDFATVSMAFWNPLGPLVSA